MSLEENKNKVLIMRQRNGCLDQDLDEIELAIEAVNAESSRNLTGWSLYWIKIVTML